MDTPDLERINTCFWGPAITSRGKTPRNFGRVLKERIAVRFAQISPAAKREIVDWLETDAVRRTLVKNFKRWPDGTFTPRNWKAPVLPLRRPAESNPPATTETPHE